MKSLIFICGPNGVGKTTACWELMHRLEHSACVQPEFCSAYNPFVFNEESIQLNKTIMGDMLASYLQSNLFQYVIWNYGFHGHRKSTFDTIMEKLSALPVEFRFIPIIFDCSITEHINRMTTDRRDAARIQRAIENTRDIYQALDYHRINVTALTVEQTVEEILKIIATEPVEASYSLTPSIIKE